MAEGADAPGAEQLQRAQLAELPEVLAERREDDVAGAVGEDARRRGDRPGGERGVVGLHHLPRRLRGGQHQRPDMAEAEEHDGAVPPGELPHGVVRQGAEQAVDTPDDRQRPWPRREVHAGVVPGRGRRLELEDDEGEE
ncbi:Os01g0957500 [Oryza sativa Japonica Group]|uniref:Os01g0957500 protein n=1 Tax=Oryza sativa subsp. japonica TaxID=39947 RepID=A0A0N7KEF8_ORYSJ|nr:Os01g0957500 [Oryza sativa Japonica Group]